MPAFQNRPIQTRYDMADIVTIGIVSDFSRISIPNFNISYIIFRYFNRIGFPAENERKDEDEESKKEQSEQYVFYRFLHASTSLIWGQWQIGLIALEKNGIVRGWFERTRNEEGPAAARERPVRAPIMLHQNRIAGKRFSLFSILAGCSWRYSLGYGLFYSIS